MRLGKQCGKSTTNCSCRRWWVPEWAYYGADGACGERRSMRRREQMEAARSSLRLSLELAHRALELRIPPNCLPPLDRRGHRRRCAAKRAITLCGSHASRSLACPGVPDCRAAPCAC
ncbi:hypothetical protein ACU4HD_46955 [Cupriavidus basilensis]